jgi:hypothetical protein
VPADEELLIEELQDRIRKHDFRCLIIIHVIGFCHKAEMLKKL